MMKQLSCSKSCIASLGETHLECIDFRMMHKIIRGPVTARGRRELAEPHLSADGATRISAFASGGGGELEGREVSATLPCVTWRRVRAESTPANRAEGARRREPVIEVDRGDVSAWARGGGLPDQGVAGEGRLPRG